MDDRDLARRFLRYRGMRALRRMLFDPACIGCEASGTALCQDCAPAISERRLMPLAALDLATGNGGRAGAQAQAECLPPLPVASLGEYATGLRTAILGFKDGRRDVGDALVELLAGQLGQLLPARIRRAATQGRLLLAGIPTTAARRRERGFDGGLLLADGLGALWGVPAWPCLRQTRGDKQRGRDRNRRLAAHGRFAACPPRGAGHEIVLVDDVLTTGATIRDAATALAQAGATVLGAIVVARVELGTPVHS